jgi:hypothetical protein
VFNDLRLIIEPFPFARSYPQMELVNEIDSGERSFVSAKITGHERSPNALTDALFYRRHPELHGRRLGKSETALGKEWLMILHDVVEPLLPKQDAELTYAQNIGASIVPGVPGVTVEQLVEQYRKKITPEIPWPVLLGFIKVESGGNFKDATHGSPGTNFTSPPFYELGLFQTPAGLHGKCTADRTTLSPNGVPVLPCTFQPPGQETRDRSEWSKLCEKIGADPNQWTNPVTQVQVGLLNIKSSAEVIRSQFKDLFPTPGSDWDLRAAVLQTFAHGAGYTRAFLTKYRAGLAKLQENQRWDFLRGRSVGNVTFDAKNVDEKIDLAARLGYRP